MGTNRVEWATELLGYSWHILLILMPNMEYFIKLSRSSLLPLTGAQVPSEMLREMRFPYQPEGVTKKQRKNCLIDGFFNDGLMYETKV